MTSLFSFLYNSHSQGFYRYSNNASEFLDKDFCAAYESHRQADNEVPAFCVCPFWLWGERSLFPFPEPQSHVLQIDENNGKKIKSKIKKAVYCLWSYSIKISHSSIYALSIPIFRWYHKHIDICWFMYLVVQISRLWN